MLGYIGRSYSAELLGNQRLQFAAGEKAGGRLPGPGGTADSLITFARFDRRSRGGFICVVQKNPLPATAGVIDCVWDCLSCGLWPHGRCASMSSASRMVSGRSCKIGVGDRDCNGTGQRRQKTPPEVTVFAFCSSYPRIGLSNFLQICLNMHLFHEEMKQRENRHEINLLLNRLLTYSTNQLLKEPLAKVRLTRR
ncbi:hypothetical protein [Rhizobium sp. Pop5]|uniref:hypothetical protein n=1 Tax=Rhizobium sp. Pop5 TaxID=1223565 RepID=UPI001969C1B9|nr:hypothetical protein [Rhizobium sp. Pop5]